MPDRITPEVSVVVPCFNLGQFVDETVQSALSQTAAPREVIIVDDGSTDPQTRGVLAAYARPLTRVVHTENRGLALARNHGATLASGRYLCFLDADDRLAPTYFEQVLAAFETGPELSFVSSWVQAFGEEDWLYTPERCDVPALLADCTVSTAAVVRREAFDAVGGFDTHMPAPGDEDWDLWLNLVTQGHEGTILPEALFYYRRRSGSMVETAYYGDDHLVLMEYLYRKYEEHFRRHRGAVDVDKQNELSQLEQNHRTLRSVLAEESSLHLSVHEPLSPGVMNPMVSPGDPLAQFLDRERQLLTLRRETKRLEDARKRRCTT